MKSNLGFVRRLAHMQGWLQDESISRNWHEEGCIKSALAEAAELECLLCCIVQGVVADASFFCPAGKAIWR